MEEHDLMGEWLEQELKSVIRPDLGLFLKKVPLSEVIKLYMKYNHPGVELDPNESASHIIKEMQRRFE